MRKSPGPTKFEAIMIEQGVTHDQNSKNGLTRCWNFVRVAGRGGVIKTFAGLDHRDVWGRWLVIAYKVYRCWVSNLRHCQNWMRAAMQSLFSPWGAGTWRLGAGLRSKISRDLSLVNQQLVTMRPLNAEMLNVWEHGLNQPARSSDFTRSYYRPRARLGCCRKIEYQCSRHAPVCNYVNGCFGLNLHNTALYPTM
jgi:hypothetical protein